MNPHQKAGRGWHDEDEHMAFIEFVNDIDVLFDPTTEHLPCHWFLLQVDFQHLSVEGSRINRKLWLI
jgi:hypothetical protein